LLLLDHFVLRDHARSSFSDNLVDVLLKSGEVLLGIFKILSRAESVHDTLLLEERHNDGVFLLFDFKLGDLFGLCFDSFLGFALSEHLDSVFSKLLTPLLEDVVAFFFS